ncbi:MAG: hypothetical protein EXR66_05580 [Dehalococcoidia bacterium]|nr:hypothetical protein [Dehalococcoidia bacterium]
MNATLLVCHQIDSAYWREWELLRIPGGAQLNLVFNFGIVLLLLSGLVWKVSAQRAGDWVALTLGVGWLFAVALHFAFLIRGDRRFRFATSLGVLAALAPVAIVQLAIEVRRLSG